MGVLGGSVNRGLQRVREAGSRREGPPGRSARGPGRRGAPARPPGATAPGHVPTPRSAAGGSGGRAKSRHREELGDSDTHFSLFLPEKRGNSKQFTQRPCQTPVYTVKSRSVCGRWTRGLRGLRTDGCHPLPGCAALA